ncbi:ubiquitin fusion degradation protein 1 [Acrasis kona]|uniref:Ubiquitin fusion degradation protein 1 n=1 Tax=Acrasis kona TaxID=1008807 RepID=A0AAW2YYN9_9EUKA
MSAQQFSRKVALFVGDKNNNQSNFKVKSISNDSIIITDEDDDLEFTIKVIDRNGKFSVHSEYDLLQGKWLDEVNQFCSSGRKDITDVLVKASTLYLYIINDDASDEDDTKEPISEQDTKVDQEGDEDEILEEPLSPLEDLIMTEGEDDQMHETVKSTFVHFVETFCQRRDLERKQSSSPLLTSIHFKSQNVNSCEVLFKVNQDSYCLHYPLQYEPLNGKSFIISCQDVSNANITKAINHVINESTSFSMDVMIPFIMDQLIQFINSQEEKQVQTMLSLEQAKSLYERVWMNVTNLSLPVFDYTFYQHLSKEITSCIKSLSNKRDGYELTLTQSSPFFFQVELFNFQCASLSNQSIHLEFMFNCDPKQPPQVRVLYPRLEYLTGSVCFDGQLRSKPLLKDTYNQNGGLIQLIKKIKQELESDGARVYRSMTMYDKDLPDYVLTCRDVETSGVTYDSLLRKKTLLAFSFDYAKDNFLMNFNSLGDRIILPHSLANKLLEKDDSTSPLLFELRSSIDPKLQKYYCGVSEFSAPEGNVIVPDYILKEMFLPEGSALFIRSVLLPVGTRIKIQPHSSDFYNRIVNHEKALTTCLEKHSCLSVGRPIPVTDDNGSIQMVQVVSAEPSGNVMITTRNGLQIEIDFVPALDLIDDSEKIIALNEAKQSEKINKIVQNVLLQYETKKQVLQSLLEDQAMTSSDDQYEIRFTLPDGTRSNVVLSKNTQCSLLYDYVFVNCHHVLKTYTDPNHILLRMRQPNMLIPNSRFETLQSCGLYSKANVMAVEVDRFK